MKINKYMHDFGVSSATLAKVAAKNYATELSTLRLSAVSRFRR